MSLVNLLAFEGLTIVKRLKPGHPPVYLVRCNDCRRRYPTRAWKNQLRRVGGCVSCVQRRRYAARRSAR